MLIPSLFSKDQSAKQILCLGAHCDDIEIGCGGTLLKLINEYTDLEIHWIILSSNPIRAEEALCSAETFLDGVEKHHIDILNFRESYFPYIAIEIKEYFDALGKRIHPDLIFTHYREDRHQDHRLISDLTWNTFRQHLILEYEILKYDGDLGRPNCYFGLTKEIMNRKIDTIYESFKSQQEKHWFDKDVLKSIMFLRGAEIPTHEKIAEGFYVRKVLLS